MNLPALFFTGIAGWLLAWSVFLGIAWAARLVPASHPLTLLDDGFDPRRNDGPNELPAQDAIVRADSSPNFWTSYP